MNDTRVYELTSLLRPGLESIKHHEEGGEPCRLDCTALLPLASKIAKVYVSCSRLIRLTEPMEGLGLNLGDIYDMRPMKRESLVDSMTKVLCRLEC